MKRALLVVCLLAGVCWDVTPSAAQSRVFKFWIRQPTGCSQTLSAGGDIDAAVAAVANGSTWTICLNSGTYSGANVNFANITRTSGYVTVKEGAGQSVTLTNPLIPNTDYLILGTGLTINGGSITACSTNIQMLGNTWVTNGLEINNIASTCTNYPANILISGNTFPEVTPPISEGRIDVRDTDANNGTDWGVTITLNTFLPAAGTCGSDGVQLTGDVDGLTIGPGNVIEIDQLGETHCDHVQFYGGGEHNVITGNWFKGNGATLIHHSGSPDGTVMTNNIFQSDGGDAGLQAGLTATNFVFEHNTICDHAGPLQITNTSTGTVARSNINLGSAAIGDDCTSGCTYSYNLCPSAGLCPTQTNGITATPVFVGGTAANCATFTDWSDWELDSVSAGNNAGHDGLDVGTRYYGP